MCFGRFHSEGSIVSTLFGLIFWDILFAPVPGAFETPYQSAPLDLVHDSFFTSREDLIQARLDELKNDDGAARRIIQAVDVRERDRETWCVGVQWDLFGRDDLMEIGDVSRSYSHACNRLIVWWGVPGRSCFGVYMPTTCRRVWLPRKRRARLVCLERGRQDVQVC